MHVLLLLSALAAGCLLAVQASVNLQLNKAIGTPYGASTVQLGVATVLLLTAATAAGALGALGGLPGVPWWFLLGGLASPLYITSGILLFPRLGALLAVGLFVTGQMFASLGLDLLGLLGVRQRPLSFAIVLGAVAVLAGITAIARGARTTTSTPPPPTALPADPAASGGSAGADTPATSAVPVGSGRSAGAGGPVASVGPVASAGSAGAGGAATSVSPATSDDSAGGRGPGAVRDVPVPAGRVAPARAGVARGGWLLLGLVAGAVLPVQGAINAKLRGELHEPLAVGLISFTVAVLAIAVVLSVLVATGRTARPRLGGLGAVPWWGWLGGACAAVYVVATFMLLPQIGAATTIALTVTGQQLASAGIDHTGAFRMARRPLTAPRLAGVALLVLGSVLVQLG